MIMGKTRSAVDSNQLLKKKSTCNNRDVFISVPLNKQIYSILKRFRIKKHRCYILKHNPCLPQKNNKDQTQIDQQWVKHR